MVARPIRMNLANRVLRGSYMTRVRAPAIGIKGVGRTTRQPVTPTLWHVPAYRHSGGGSR
jgi:hypothetical protein